GWWACWTSTARSSGASMPRTPSTSSGCCSSSWPARWSPNPASPPPAPPPESRTVGAHRQLTGARAGNPRPPLRDTAAQRSRRLYMAKQPQASGGKVRADARRHAPPGEDPGTLTDEEYLSVGGPDALDAAAPSPEPRTRDAHRNQSHGDERTDDGLGTEGETHADSPP